MLTAARITLVLAGLVAVYVGGSLLLSPVAFEASAGITLGPDPALLSEIRAPGGAILLGGLFMWLGAARPRLTHPAMLAAAALYLAFGLSRLVAMALDGSPGEPLLLVTALEIGVGLLALAMLRITGQGAGEGERGRAAHA